MAFTQTLDLATAECLPLCSAKDLRRAVLQARADVPRLAAAGLDRILRWDAARALIEVQSGTAWRALAARLAPSAPALEACIAQGGLRGTVGEALSTNAPGPDGRPLVALVEAATLVTPDGELQCVSRTRNADLFALAVGGHGLFGLTYSISLRVEALAQAALRARPAESVELQRPGIGPTRASVLLIPPAQLEAFLADARALTDEWRVPIAHIDVARTLPEQETILRWAKQAYAAVTLQLVLPQPLGACVRGTQLCRALIDCAIQHGGSFPIATTREASRAQLEACYPELKAVLAEKARRDPGARLVNAWYRHHRRVLEDARVAVRWNAAQAASA
jgi:hypothetical protein